MIGNKRRSKYDDYFTVLVDGDHQCNACNAVIRRQAQRGTSNRLAHLNHCKSFNKNEIQGQPIKKICLTIAPPPGNFDGSSSTELNQLISRFLSSSGLDFSIVDNFYFQEIIRFQCLASTIIPKRKDIENLVSNEAKNCVETIKSQFDPAQPIGLKLDEYSNGQNCFVKLTGTQITNSWTINNFRLGVFSLKINEKSADIIQENVERILNDLDIKNVVGLTQNDASIVENFSDLFGYDLVHCFCQTLNISIQAGYAEIMQVLTPILEFICEFKKCPISIQILEEKCDSSEKLRGLTKTRWTSALDCLQSFLSNIESFQKFLTLKETANLPILDKIPNISNEFKKELKEFCEVLKILDDMMKLAEEKSCTCSTIVFLKYSIQILIDEEFRSSLVKKFMTGFQNKWETLSTCYKNNEMIEMAAVLDPRIIDRFLKEEEWKIIKEKIKKYCPENDEQEIVIKKEIKQEDGQQQFWQKHSEIIHVTQSQKSKFEKEIVEYFVSEKIPNIQMYPTIDSRVNEALNFWKNKEEIWPQLSALARRFLSVSCSSSEPERIFMDLGCSLPTLSNLNSKATNDLFQINSYLALKKMDENSRNLENSEFFNLEKIKVEFLD